MPLWMDALNALGRPLAPKGTIQGLQEGLAPGSSAPLPGGEGDTLDMILGGLGLPPEIRQVPGALGDIGSGLVNHPLETLGGGLSGALEGARSLTTPASMMAAMPALGVAGRLGRFGRGAALSELGAGPADDAVRMVGQIDDIPFPQRAPSMPEVDELAGQLSQNLSRIPNATGKLRRPGAPMAGLDAATSARPNYASMPPEFTPRGQEAVYNAGRPAGVAQGPSVVFPPPSAFRGR